MIRHYSDSELVPNYRPSAFIAWAIGSAAAIAVQFQVPSYSEAVVGLLVGGLRYYALSKASSRVASQ